MKASVPTALHLEDNSTSFLTPYSPGKLNTTYVSGEMGFNRMGMTCPFPVIVDPNVLPLAIIRKNTDVVKRNTFVPNANYNVVFDASTKIATVNGEIGWYNTSTHPFLPASGHYIALSIAFPDAVEFNASYDLASLKIGNAPIISTPPILSGQEKAERKLFVIVPVDTMMDPMSPNPVSIMIDWGINVETETIVVEFQNVTPMPSIP